MSKNNYCDEDCNNCKIINSNNYKMVYKILFSLYLEDEDNYLFVQNNCPNMTVCPECRIDDFCHVEECKLSEKIVLESIISNNKKRLDCNTCKYPHCSSFYNSIEECTKYMEQNICDCKFCKEKESVTNG